MAAAAEALVLAHRGELAQAEALARTAVATAETRTDNVWWRADGEPEVIGATRDIDDGHIRDIAERRPRDSRRD